MTTRRSADFDVPAPPPEPPLPANVLNFFTPPRLPFTISPIAVGKPDADVKPKGRPR